MKNSFNIYTLDGEELLDAVEEDLSDAIKHGMLVCNLASAVARELNETPDFVKEISLAGMMHDIGKLRLCKYLYGRKKDILEIEEMKYVRMHPTFSLEIVKQSGFKESIQQMVYHHHENYDGSGYPDNLKGRAIPWGARILRTCDVFAALVSKRPYRDAFDVEPAMELMIDEVKNFDMKIFLAFQRVIFSEDFLDIQRVIGEINNNHNILEEKKEDWTKLLQTIFRDVKIWNINSQLLD